MTHHLAFQTLGGLSAEVHCVQAHGALGRPHVQPHIEAMGDVVVHSLFQTPAVLLWRGGFLPAAGGWSQQTDGRGLVLWGADHGRHDDLLPGCGWGGGVRVVGYFPMSSFFTSRSEFNACFL